MTTINRHDYRIFLSKQTTDTPETIEKIAHYIYENDDLNDQRDITQIIQSLPLHYLEKIAKTDRTAAFLVYRKIWISLLTILLEKKKEISDLLIKELITQIKLPLGHEEKGLKALFQLAYQQQNWTFIEIFFSEFIIPELTCDDIVSVLRTYPKTREHPNFLQRIVDQFIFENLNTDQDHIVQKCEGFENYLLEAYLRNFKHISDKKKMISWLIAEESVNVGKPSLALKTKNALATPEYIATYFLIHQKEKIEEFVNEGILSKDAVITSLLNLYQSKSWSDFYDILLERLMTSQITLKINQLSELGIRYVVQREFEQSLENDKANTDACWEKHKNYFSSETYLKDLFYRNLSAHSQKKINFGHITRVLRYLVSKGVSLNAEIINSALQSVQIRVYDRQKLFEFLCFLIDLPIKLAPSPLLADFLYFATAAQWNALLDKSFYLSLKELPIPVFQRGGRNIFEDSYASTYPSPMWTYLFFITRRQELAEVREKLLRKGELNINEVGYFYDPHIPSEKETTVLHCLLNLGKLDEILEVIKLGANVNYRSSDHLFVLQRAAEKLSDKEFETVLLSSNQWSQEQLNTVLSFSISNKEKFQKAILLIKQGARLTQEQSLYSLAEFIIYLSDGHDQTTLEKVEAFECDFNRLVIPGVGSEKKQPFLWFLYMTSHKELMSRYLGAGRLSINYPRWDGRTLLAEISSCGNNQLSQQLVSQFSASLDIGTPISFMSPSKGGNDFTLNFENWPLGEAVKQFNLRLVTYFLENGATLTRLR